ncbi:hypothetical protein PPL_02963 [Heterostelium album PN500]|uniref:Cathepsin propeptide inhibitor domain-containing protein n=1 Tax=Heterostelium pallidum (strain ATCC 26659 / Pp 5 / PN500) TaxID=670386 RepID=D3B3J5_HETP5|nr:hypothetical protein PPL_02963 [Heterostelium album PN500]EFA83893.1 hypothetical protein PPL_02963 [Heterostelium album PN500]|eukprot:XP_020436010.1 hypothetical protein PPL_02963 [Heterostelium album PN500]
MYGFHHQRNLNKNQRLNFKTNEIIQNKIFKINSLILIFVNSVNSQAIEYNFETAFQNYVEAYGKQYTSQDYQNAFKAFKVNFEKIQQVNAKWEGSNVHIEYVETPATLRSLSDVANEPVISFPSENIQTMDLNTFSDLTYEEFASTFTGADAAFAPAVAGAATAVLSTGAIIGIAVGGGSAAIAVAAGITVAVKRRKRNQVESSSTPEVEMKTTPKGIDIFKWRRSKHQSITARAMPIDKQ